MTAFIDDFTISLLLFFVFSLFVALAVKGAYRIVLLEKVSYLDAYMQCLAVLALQYMAFAMGTTYLQLYGDGEVAWLFFCACVIPLAWWPVMLPTPQQTRTELVRGMLIGLAVVNIVAAAMLLPYGSIVIVYAEDNVTATEGAAITVGAFLLAAALMGIYMWRRRLQKRVQAFLSATANESCQVLS